jgi:hypothetical protein
MEALQVPKWVAVDFAETAVELAVWEVEVGVRVADMAARLDMRLGRVNDGFCFCSLKILARSIHIRKRVDMANE